HQGRRFVRSDGVVHGPDPGKFEVLHVVARDLRERAVIPRLIIPADHPPVARVGAAQLLGGDRHVVLHFASEGKTRRRAGSSSGGPSGGSLSSGGSPGGL